MNVNGKDRAFVVSDQHLYQFRPRNNSGSSTNISSNGNGSASRPSTRGNDGSASPSQASMVRSVSRMSLISSK